VEALVSFENTYPVIIVVGNHDEQLKSHALRATLGHQHVVWPSTAAEVVYGLVGRVIIRIAESALERNGYVRVHGFPRMRRLSGRHRNHKLVQLHHQAALFLQFHDAITLIQHWRQEDANESLSRGSTGVLHLDVVGEFAVLQMGEPGGDLAARREVQAAGHVQIGLLPEGGQHVGLVSALHIDALNAYAREAQIFRGIWGQTTLVLLEQVVDKGVPLVKDWIAHGGGRIAHYT